MMKKHASAEEFIASYPKWKEILVPLRKLLMATELEETIKWSVPVYTLGGKNVAGLMAFKNHAAIWFFNGALLKDKRKRLVNAQEGVTKAQRQWRFKTADGVELDLIRAYVDEAINNQKQGKVVKKPARKSLSIPEELNAALDGNKELKSAFAALTAFKQKEYAGYISGAKQQKTRDLRTEKIIPMILKGQGLNDRYRC
jgi:uncharacterized protein YdeI (YjbR/CyaY-like superfamily)